MRLGRVWVDCWDRALCGSCFLAGVVSAVQEAVIFTFENESNATPFTDTVGGLSVTFESSGDPFAVGNGGSFFSFTFK